MIKLTFCLVRLPRLSRDEFQNYWYGTHAPLVASVADTLQIRRYVQMHSLPSEASAGMRASRDAPPKPPPYRAVRTHRAAPDARAD